MYLTFASSRKHLLSQFTKYHKVVCWACPRSQSSICRGESWSYSWGICNKVVIIFIFNKWSIVSYHGTSGRGQGWLVEDLCRKCRIQRIVGLKALEKCLYTHIFHDLASDKPVAELEAGLGVEPAVPGVVGALTGLTWVLRSNRKDTFKRKKKKETFIGVLWVQL